MTLSPCHTLQNVLQTQQKFEPCQLKLSTPFPAGGFPYDTASSTCPKAQTWPQFNHHALDNNGLVKRHTQDTTNEFNIIPRTDIDDEDDDIDEDEDEDDGIDDEDDDVDEVWPILFGNKIWCKIDWALFVKPLGISRFSTSL